MKGHPDQKVFHIVKVVRVNGFVGRTDTAVQRIVVEADDPVTGGVVHILGRIGDYVRFIVIESGDPRCHIGYGMVKVDLHGHSPFVN
jgi:hypothetical protein